METVSGKLKPKKKQRYGYGTEQMTRHPPESPTNARPGSEEKIRVLMERARLEQLLHHPDDVTLHDLDK